MTASVKAEEAAKTSAQDKGKPVPVDFVRHVQPIFAEHCYSCHAADTTEGGIRWDRKTAFAGGDSGEPAIVPGQPDQSYLIHVLRDDEEMQMPPEDEGEPLSKEQIDLIARWIQQGAPWPDEAQAALEKSNHWAFLPPENYPAPEVQDTQWPRNYIDQFVLARLEQEGLKPAREADRYTLARRVYLDLIGLPPSPRTSRRLCQRHATRRLRKNGRCLARLTPLWRAMGPYVARSGPLCRYPGL